MRRRSRLRTRRVTVSVASIVAIAAGPLAPAQPAAAQPDPATRTTKPNQPGQIVQMGDSYSAGNGSGNYTDHDCWRSPSNYGAQVAAALHKRFTDVSCAGGVVADILSPRTIGAAKTVAPQVEAVTPATRYVFLTIGGNDIGFGNLVAACLIYRSPGLCPQAVGYARYVLPTMIARTRLALQAIYDRSKGHAQVYLLGYPYLLNTASYRIPEQAPVFDAGAALYTLQTAGSAAQAAMISELNAINHTSDFHFVDVAASWGGTVHGLDPHVAADQSASWLVPVMAPGRAQAEWVHPTQTGWNATAAALLAAIG